MIFSKQKSLRIENYRATHKKCKFCFEDLHLTNWLTYVNFTRGSWIIQLCSNVDRTIDCREIGPQKIFAFFMGRPVFMSPEVEHWYNLLTIQGYGFIIQYLIKFILHTSTLFLVSMSQMFLWIPIHFNTSYHDKCKSDLMH